MTLYSPEKSAVSDAQQSVSNTNHMVNVEQSPSDEQRNATFVHQSPHQSENTIHQSTQLGVPQTDAVSPEDSSQNPRLSRTNEQDHCDNVPNSGEN